jgi:hypothetical protein
MRVEWVRCEIAVAVMVAALFRRDQRLSASRLAWLRPAFVAQVVGSRRIARPLRAPRAFAAQIRNPRF